MRGRLGRSWADSNVIWSLAADETSAHMLCSALSSASLSLILTLPIACNITLTLFNFTEYKHNVFNVGTQTLETSGYFYTK